MASNAMTWPRERRSESIGTKPGAAPGKDLHGGEPGARGAAPSTPARPPSRPGPRSGRARARRLSLLLPVLALLLGALGPFAPAPAEAQTVTLVTNFGQTKLTGTRFTGDNSLAQGFRTGSNSGGYTLTSIEAISRGGGTAVQAATVRAELWSATTGGAPDSKIADLTIPTGAVAANTTMSFGAPSGTTLTANTTYYFVIYTVGAFDLALEGTSAHAEDSGGQSGWTIADALRFQARSDTPSGASWATDSQGAIALIRVKGSAKQDTTNANLSALTAATHTSSTGTFTSLTLTPSTFAATTTSYTATVGNARTHLKLTPTVAATGATVKVGKGTSLATVTSGSASAAIPLSVGSNAITVEVTAQDNTTKKTYTVTVRRHAASTIWHATLTPQAFTTGVGGVGCTSKAECDTQLSDNSFSFGGTNYHFVGFSDANTGTGANKLFVQLNADTTAAFRALKLCVGSLEFAIADISQDLVRLASTTDPGWTAGTPVELSIGSSCSQQTTTPTQSSDATLSGLTATQATSASGPFSALSIGNFASGTTSYAASVANSITHVKLTPTVNDSNATVKVGKGSSLTTVTSGQPSAAIPLSVGQNALKVEVTAQDGTTRTYTVTVTRRQAQTQAPAPVVPTGRGETVWSATLTVQNLGAPLLGCSTVGATRCALTSVLTDDDFSLFGKTYSVRSIQLNAGTLVVTFDQSTSTQAARRLTLHVGDRELPLAEGTFNPSRGQVTWSSTGLTWSASQSVPLRVTLGPRWSGVAYEGGGLLPGPTGGQELLVAEDGSATFGVKLTHAPTANVTIRLYKFAPAAIHGNANAVTFSPKTLTFTPANYGTAQTVTVTGVPDGNARHEHLYIMAASSSADANYALQDGHEALFVTVTDGAGAVKVGLSRGAARESGDGSATNAPVTVWLNRASTSQVRVTYATAPDPDAPSDKRATAGSDYTHVSGTLVFQPGQTRKTVQVPILDDNVEDSGERFRFVLSNVQGATLEQGYGRATMVILNDEAQIDGLSVEGAPGAGGPWAKLDIGAFAPETAAYAVTVPHGTTHARVTPETADEDLLLWAGSGTGLASVRSGQAGSTVALAVGENVLLVQTRAATGKRQTYRVTVTRQAAQQQPEAQQPEAQQQARDPLTARLRGAVQEHDGATPFMLELVLSESLDSGSRWPSAASFKVKGGSVESVRRFRPYRYQVHVKPKSWKEVTVTLAGGRACSEEGAICTPDGRSVSNTSTMTVGGPVRIRVENARAREGKDASLDFAVTLNRAAAQAVSVDYATEDGTAKAGADYTAVSGTLTFAAGETAKTVSVPVLDDAHDEGRETMRLKLSNPKGAYLRNVHRQAKGVIRNDDLLQQAWLARFGRMVASDAVGAVTARLETPRDAGSHVTFAGQRVNFGEAEHAEGPGSGSGAGKALTDVLTGLARAFGARRAPAPDDDDPFARNGLSSGWNDRAASAAPRSVTGRELLLGTSFRMVLDRSAGAQWTGWGQGASVSRFSAAGTGLGLTGESATGSMGMDWEQGRLLLGFAMTHSVGEGAARDAGWRYALGSTATMALPYARLRLTERVSVWGLAGAGKGRLTLDIDGAVAQKYRTDLSMSLVAMGGRGDLLTPEQAGGFALALKADAFWVGTKSDRVKASAFGSLAGARGESSRVRAVLDGSRTFSFASGAALTPSLELGVRHDSGDAETGTGLEVGAGLGYADPSRGLDMALKVHGLAVHAERGYEEWGVSGQLRLVPGGAGRGLSMSLTPSWGVDPAGSQRLWALPASSGLAAQANGAAEPSGRFDAEVGYGLALFGDRFTGTPNVGFGLSETAREYRMGWRLTSAVEGDPGFEVSLDATRREAANDPGSGSGAGKAEHGVMLRSTIRW